VCERAFGLPKLAILITEEQLGGASTKSERCGVAQAALTLVAAKFRHPLPKRSLASPSVTRFDLCALLDQSGAESLPKMEGTIPTQYYAGGECSLRGTGLTITVRFAFDTEDDPLPTVHHRDHELQVVGDTKGCEAVSVQGQTQDGAKREILDVTVTPAEPGLKFSLCEEAEDALVDILDLAHLH